MHSERRSPLNIMKLMRSRSSSEKIRAGRGVYTPSLYSCDSEGLYNDGHSKGAPSTSASEARTQSFSSPCTSISEESQRLSDAYSATSLNDIISWSRKSSLAALDEDDDDSSIASDERQDIKLTRANLQRHTLMKVFANDALNDYFSEKYCTPISDDEYDNVYLQDVSPSSPTWSLGFKEWKSMPNLAQTAEVCEDTRRNRFILEETIEEEVRIWSGSVKVKN